MSTNSTKINPLLLYGSFIVGALLIVFCTTKLNGVVVFKKTLAELTIPLAGFALASVIVERIIKSVFIKKEVETLAKQRKLVKANQERLNSLMQSKQMLDLHAQLNTNKSDSLNTQVETMNESVLSTEESLRQSQVTLATEEENVEQKLSWQSLIGGFIFALFGFKILDQIAVLEPMVNTIPDVNVLLKSAADSLHNHIDSYYITHIKNNTDLIKHVTSAKDTIIAIPVSHFEQKLIEPITKSLEADGAIKTTHKFAHTLFYLADYIISATLIAGGSTLTNFIVAKGQ